MKLIPISTRPAGVAAAALAATLILVLGGCASAPVPMHEMAMAETAVQRANTTATGEMAPAELGLAVNKLSQARSALAAGDRDRARRLAEQATLDAQVAELHAQAGRSAAAARESDNAARALREEISRKTPR